MTSGLACPRCRRPLEPGAFVDGCGGAYPAHHALLWSCPACGHDAVVRLDTGLLEFGAWEGIPGPRFVVHESAPSPEWSVEWRDVGPQVRCGETTWLLGADASDQLPELRVAGGEVQPLDEAELDAATARLGETLPPSYRMFMRRYGPGIAMDALRILPPARLRWQDGLLVFGEGLDGQTLGWNTRLRAGRGELWIDVLAPGLRHACIAASLEELLLLAVDVRPRPTSLKDPLLIGDRYTERLFEPEPR